MMRPLFAAAAAALFGAGVPAAHAQCGCARPAAGGTVRSTSPGVKSAVPTTVRHNVAASSGVTSPPAGVSCPLCAAGVAAHAHAAPDDKPKADEKPAAKADKEVTLTGAMVCAKCGLKEPGVKKCTNALQVKDGDMTVTYFLDDKGNGEPYHEGLCGGGTKAGAKVTGTTSEKDGRRWVKATKVEEKK